MIRHTSPRRPRAARTRLLIVAGATAAAGLLMSACVDEQPVQRASDDVTALSSGVLTPGVTEQLQAALDATVAEYDVPGAVARVRLPGGEWTSAVGVADRESDAPMTDDLVWPIRSITKSFTVTVLLQLVDDGEISLDDTLDEWVPEMTNSDEITLGQLADMTSGVPEYTNEAFIEAFIEDQDAAFSTEDLIGFALTEDPSSEPGEAHLYINTSTVLLGEVIKQVTGQDFDEVVAERVLEPLGLDDTVYVTEPHGWTGPHATGYQPDEDGELGAQDANFTVFGTAGAMSSTLDDLTAWGPVLATGELLEDDTHAARLVGSPLDEGPEYDSYAYGIGEIAGWWGHTGEGFGVTALVMHDVAADATVAIFMNLSNVGDHPPTKLFREFARILAS